MAVAHSRGGKKGLGSRDQGEQHVAAASKAVQLLSLFREPLYTCVKLVINMHLAVFWAVGYMFKALSQLVSWTSLGSIHRVPGGQPEAPINTQRSALYRVERFTWTNSRYVLMCVCPLPCFENSRVLFLPAACCYISQWHEHGRRLPTNSRSFS